MRPAIAIIGAGVLVAGCDQAETEKPEVEGWAEVVRQPSTEPAEISIEVTRIGPATTRPVTPEMLERWKEVSD